MRNDQRHARKVQEKKKQKRSNLKLTKSAPFETSHPLRTELNEAAL